MKLPFPNRCLYESPSLTPDLMNHSTKMTIHQNSEMYIENFKCIINASDHEIIVRAKKNVIKILGCRLCIDYYSKNEIKISGTINCVNYME